jgi:hypothetical protein
VLALYNANSKPITGGVIAREGLQHVEKVDLFGGVLP